MGLGILDQNYFDSDGNIKSGYGASLGTLQNIIRDKIAEILTNKLVIISEKNFARDLPKYPITDPNKGRNKIAYSI